MGDRYYTYLPDMSPYIYYVEEMEDGHFEILTHEMKGICFAFYHDEADDIYSLVRHGSKNSIESFVEKKSFAYEGMDLKLYSTNDVNEKISLEEINKCINYGSGYFNKICKELRDMNEGEVGELDG